MAEHQTWARPKARLFIALSDNTSVELEPYIANLESGNARLREELEFVRKNEGLLWKNECANYKEEVAYLKSLIAWHKVEDGLPETVVILRHCNSDGSVDYTVAFGPDVDAEYWSEWRYIEPPQEAKEKE